MSLYDMTLGYGSAHGMLIFSGCFGLNTGRHSQDDTGSSFLFEIGTLLLQSVSISKPICVATEISPSAF
jgi:hypothetical protein